MTLNCVREMQNVPAACCIGAKAEADANRAKRARIVFIILTCEYVVDLDLIVARGICNSKGKWTTDGCRGGRERERKRQRYDDGGEIEGIGTVSRTTRRLRTSCDRAEQQILQNCCIILCVCDDNSCDLLCSISRVDCLLTDRVTDRSRAGKSADVIIIIKT